MPRVQVDNPIEFLLEYGIEVVGVSEGGEGKVICPFHDDSNPSALVNIEKGVFICPVCEAKGDLIDLAAGSMEVKRATITSHLQAQQVDSDIVPINGALIHGWHQVLLSSKFHIDLLKDRKGITIKSIKENLLGLDGDRITIPISSSSGSFINVRKWSPTDKKRKIINMKGRGRRTLYPIKSLEEDTVYITEGEMKALLLRQMSLNGIAPTGGASTWAASWNGLFKDKIVYILYDVDKPGKRGAQKVARNLYPHAKEVYVVDLPIDPSEFPTGDVTDMVVILNMGRSELDQCCKDTPQWKPAPLASEIIDDEKVYQVALSETSKAKHYMKFISTSAVVSAKDTAPYLVPKLADIHCPKDKEYCHLCPVYNEQGDEVKLEVDPKHPAILSLVNTPDERIAKALKQVAGIPRQCEQCRFNVTETQNVEEIRLIPELIVHDDDEREDDPHVVRRAFYSGHGLETNTAYQFEARVVPEPRTQYATLIAYKAEPMMDALSTFKISDETSLKIFQPKDWSKDAIAEKLDDIYDDLEANITRIYHRRDLHIFYDLVYHSMLYIPFGRKNIRGWMEGLVLGDSGQGKSETLSMLMKHYALGEKLDAKGASVAGLLGGVQETAKRWFVTWGVIPLNDRRLVALEEVKGMRIDTIEKLTDMRSSGIADLSKIEKARTNARTRLLWISNPRSDQQLASYNFGVYAIKELIGSLEDIRRFDLAIMVASGEVSRSVLNMREKDQPHCPHIYENHLCRDLILWAWSRKPEDIKFAEGAIEAILHASEEMGRTFVANIPLVEPADQRHKIARMACALAARTFSRDPESGKLIVHKGHAEYVHEYLNRIYSTPIFGYKEYSDLVKGETQLRDGDAVEQFLKNTPNAADVIRNLLEWSGFSYTDWIDVTEHDRDTARTAISFLVRKNAIRRGRGGLYFKTPAFIALIRKMDLDDVDNKSLGELVNEGDI